MDGEKVDVVVEHLDGDVIDEHLRTSTAVLQDIMGEGDTNHRRGDPICPYCGKRYKSQNTLRKHVELKHSNEETRCNECDKTYKSLLSLVQHAKYMHCRHKCKVCYRTFNSADALVLHGETCRKMEITCELCGHVYISAVSLKNHMKYKHPQSKTNWCELCRRGFASHNHLVNHRYTVHPEGATVCHCGRVFPSVPALQSHVLYKHTEGNAKCHHCHKPFMTTTSLKRHLLKLHSIDVNAITESEGS